MKIISGNDTDGPDPVRPAFRAALRWYFRDDANANEQTKIHLRYNSRVYGVYIGFET